MDTSNTLKRGLFHIFGGLSIAVAAWFLPRVVLLVFLGAAVFFFLLFELVRFGAPGINRWFFLVFQAAVERKRSITLDWQ